MYQIILSLRTLKNLETILKISGKSCCGGSVVAVWGAGVCLAFFSPTETDVHRSISSFTEQGTLHSVSHFKKKKMLSSNQYLQVLSPLHLPPSLFTPPLGGATDLYVRSLGRGL